MFEISKNPAIYWFMGVRVAKSSLLYSTYNHYLSTIKSIWFKLLAEIIEYY